MFLSPSMLERLYVRGSLQNTENGFEFRLKNNVDSGTMSSVKSIKVDEAEMPLAAITVSTPAGSFNAEQINARSPLSLRYGSEIILRVTDHKLEPGSHAVALAIMVMEIGRVDLKFQDEINA